LQRLSNYEKNKGQSGAATPGGLDHAPLMVFFYAGAKKPGLACARWIAGKFNEQTGGILLRCAMGSWHKACEAVAHTVGRKARPGNKREHPRIQGGDTK